MRVKENERFVLVVSAENWLNWVIVFIKLIKRMQVSYYDLMILWIYAYLNISYINVSRSPRAVFEILVVRAPGTTTKVAGQPKILTQLSDGQPEILTPQLWKWNPAIIVYLVPCTDNQKQGWTTRNCSLFVRGTAILFFLNSNTDREQK